MRNGYSQPAVLGDGGDWASDTPSVVDGVAVHNL